MTKRFSLEYRPLEDWTGRKTFVDRRGYIRVFCPEHPKNIKGYYYEHRMVMEAAIGRLLQAGETVHHISECKTDNRLINLFLCDRDEHNKAHALRPAYA